MRPGRGPHLLAASESVLCESCSPFLYPGSFATRIETTGTLAWLNSSLDRPMVLLHHVVEIANWSTAAAPTEFPSPLELRNDPRISGVPVYVDDSRTWMVC